MTGLLKVSAGTMRFICSLLSLWKLGLLAAFLLLPAGPHLLVGEQIYHCTYLGSRGFVPIRHFRHCPFLAMIDSRTQRGMYE